MRRYPKGISRRPEGWRVSLGPGGRDFRKSFPPATPQQDVEKALHDARLRIGAGQQTSKAGSFDADITQYLTDYFKGRTGYAERERHLHLWRDALGADQVRSSITRADVSRVLQQWRASGLAADTCNKRRTALLALYHALDGKGGSNPVREIPKFRPPAPLPRGIPYTLIEKTLKQLPRCKTRARLALMAYVGARPGQIMRLTADHWDVRRRLLTIPGTEKGRGTRTYTVPLSPAAHDALRDFDALEAWGVFTWAPMGRMWKEAWVAATTGQKRIELRGKCAGIPTPVPYDLRHSLGTAVYRKTGDLKAAKELLGHSSLRMTERYTLAAVPERQRRAIATTFRRRKLPSKVATSRKRSRKRVR